MMHFYRNRADRSSIYVERIQNVAGSTAGAGSADYYAYRNRRRDALAKANWDEKMAMIEGDQKEFEERNFEERFVLDMKADKKKSKREKRKANKQLAKQAKQFNKFENDGGFLDKYLGKRQEEVAENTHEDDDSNEDQKDSGKDSDDQQKSHDDDESNNDEGKKSQLKEIGEPSSKNKATVVAASEKDTIPKGEQPQKILVDKSKEQKESS